MENEGSSGSGGERNQNNSQALEERLKIAEERAEKAEKSKLRIEEESKNWKSKAQKAGEAEAERLKEIEADKEKELVAKGEYKKLLEQQKEENARLKKEREDAQAEARATRETLTEARKLSAFENRLGGKLKNDKYLGFVNTKDIVVDPESGDIDVSSVDNAVKGFLGEHKDLVSFSAGKMPNYQGGKGESINHKQWKGMSHKDRLENLSKAVENDTRSRKKR